MNPLHNLGFAILTGSTCGDACWHAREEICRCSCGGVNHGILNQGGERPQRTCKIKGHFYELVAVIPGRGDGEAWINAFDRVRMETNRIIDERFPNLDHYSYGQFRPGDILPVVDRKISDSQAKWPEVQAVPNAYRLVWARPEHTEYYVSVDHKSVMASA